MLHRPGSASRSVDCDHRAAAPAAAGGIRGGGLTDVSEAAALYRAGGESRDPASTASSPACADRPCRGNAAEPGADAIDRRAIPGRPRYGSRPACRVTRRSPGALPRPEHRRGLFLDGWAAEGRLVVTPGNETDFDEIERDVRELCSRFQVVSVGYDPWQSTQDVAASTRRRRPDARVPGDDAELQPGDRRAGRRRALQTPAPRRQFGARVVPQQCRRARPTGGATCIQRSSGRSRRSTRPSRS